MSVLSELIRRVPFQDAYNRRAEENEVSSGRDIAQAGGLMGILNQMQAQQQKQQALQREQQMRGALAQLPADATPEQVAAAARPFADAQDVLRTASSAADNRARIDESRRNHDEARKQRLHEIELQGQREIARVREAESQRRITKQEADARHAMILREMQQGRLDGIRLAASLRPAPAEQPPVAIPDQASPTGFRYGTRAEALGKPAPAPAAGIAGANNNAMRLRGDYDRHPEVKLANSLEPKVGPMADYIVSIGRGMGNPVGDAELVKLWLMTTHPKGDQISNLDHRQIEKMPDLWGRVKNVAGNFAFGKTLDADTRRDMWKSVSEKFKATDSVRQRTRAEVLQRGAAMKLDSEAIFPTKKEGE